MTINSLGKTNFYEKYYGIRATELITRSVQMTLRFLNSSQVMFFSFFGLDIKKNQICFFYRHLLPLRRDQLELIMTSDC